MTSQPQSTTPQAAAAPRDALAVRASGLGKSIDDRAILSDITLEVPRGACVALLGKNGAGKSTLLNVLATLTRPTSGELELFGQPVRADATRLRARIGLIGHQSMLYRDLSARENLEFFGRLYGVADPRARAAELLERVGLSQRAGDVVRTYSRGMTQRLGVARALMHNPDLLLADEPFAGLDVPSTRTVEQLISDLRAEGRTVILTNHDVPQTLALSPRVIVLRDGRIALDELSEFTNVHRVTREVIGP